MADINYFDYLQSHATCDGGLKLRTECECKQRLADGPLNKCQSEVSIDSVLESSVSLLGANKKIAFIGLDVHGDDDIINIARLCRSADIRRAGWAVTIDDSVVYQNIVSVSIPRDDISFKMGDVFDMRSPIDISWFVRESIRWHRANGAFLAIYNPTALSQDVLCREIELNDDIIFNNTNLLRRKLADGIFRGIVITDNERFTVIRSNGEIFGDVGIKCDGRIGSENSDGFSAERSIASLFSVNTNSGDYSLLVTTDSDNRVTGVASISANLLLELKKSQRIGLIERFKFSNDAANCYAVLGCDSTSQFTDEISNLTKRGVFRKFIFLPECGEKSMKVNFYDYLNGINGKAIQKQNETTVGDSVDNETDRDTSRINSEKEHIVSNAPKPPVPRWFSEIRDEMKNRLVQDVKDMELDEKNRSQSELSKSLAETVERDGGNIHGLGNGNFRDPTANNPARVQTEGSMATLE